MNVKCPVCKFEFEACCIDYREELNWFVKCPGCKNRFLVKV